MPKDHCPQGALVQLVVINYTYPRSGISLLSVRLLTVAIIIAVVRY